MDCRNQYMVDKTQCLEKGIEIYPSIYIEGAAASGKTTAVRCLLKRHPEVGSVIFEPGEMSCVEKFSETLHQLGERMRKEALWAVFELRGNEIGQDVFRKLVRFVQELPENCRAIFLSRERPAEPLLELLWKRKMELIPQRELCFTEEELQRLVELWKSPISAAELFRVTGGWPGCVDLILRLTQKNAERKNVSELRDSYEIQTYLEKEIIETLSEDEEEVFRRAAVCPWLNAELCRDIWRIPQAEAVMELLERKGLLVYHREKKRWKTAPLFQNDKKEISKREWEYLGEWYGDHGFTYEALQCLKRAENDSVYREYMCGHYYEIPFLGCPYGEVMRWKEALPQIIYLRGMYCYEHRDFEGLEREIGRLHPERSGAEQEIFLNLLYMNPKVPLGEWLELLEMQAETGIHLFHILGNGYTFLCGIRDLSALFACSKKEESIKEKIWRKKLKHTEQISYHLAKIDYYLETEQKGRISEEDLLLLERFAEDDPWQFRLAGMYLLCKLQKSEATEEREEKIHYLERSLIKEESAVCQQNVRAVSSLYSVGRRDAEMMLGWLRYTEEKAELSEENYSLRCCQAKGYLLLNQYERSERILRHLIPYMKEYKRYRFLTELLFQQAVINGKKNKPGLSLKNMIELFVFNGDCRYVTFYTGYGRPGIETMQLYREWIQNSMPERWERKNKYNYGNIQRMPWEDYLETVFRSMKKEERKNPMKKEKRIEERLTLMETIVLQSIGRGMTNAEIAEELELKLTTVKSHVYSLYKKLEISTRVQAVNKGKELGIIN